jgi:phosphatidylglycerophosphatase A
MNYRYIVAKSYATLGPIGYYPASGTCATIAALPFIWVLHFYGMSVQIVICTLIIYSAFNSIQLILPSFEKHDPSCIVIDEVVGIIVAFFTFSIGLDYTSCAIVILFRLLDILKPLGIAYIDRLPGALGVLLDDVVAGIVTNLCVQGIICLLG